jgi:hypothetical protein
MGSALLAHILYCCNKIDTDPTLLFSDTGDCHSISKLNTTNLIALDRPIDRTDHVSVLKLVPNSTYHLLRFKMSYEKWYREFPTADNFARFNFSTSYEQTEVDFLESLAVKYNGIITDYERGKDYNIVTIESFLKNDMGSVRKVVEDMLSWSWDSTRSDGFHQAVIQANEKYLDWFQKINIICEQSIRLELIATEGLAFWEKAAIIALVCYQLKVPVLKLLWHDQRLLLGSDNGFLIEDLKRILKNGKTV